MCVQVVRSMKYLKNQRNQMQLDIYMEARKGDGEAAYI